MAIALGESSGEPAFRPGLLLDGRFEVCATLGSGGMGKVWHVRDHKRGSQEIALKLASKSKTNQGLNNQARILREATCLAKIRHPNVVQSFELVSLGAYVGYTMERVSGISLGQVLTGGHALNFSELAFILVQICRGVKAIHKAGYYHLDIKPENILLTNEQVVKIVDLGIAARIQPEQDIKPPWKFFYRNPKRPSVEIVGIAGTVDYMTPEYLETSSINASTDLYAAGLVAYELLTHRLPFPAKGVDSIMQKVEFPPHPLRLLRTDCPPSLAEIVMRMIAHETSQRYPRVEAVLNDLEPVVAKLKRNCPSPDWLLHLQTARRTT